MNGNGIQISKIEIDVKKIYKGCNTKQRVGLFYLLDPFLQENMEATHQMFGFLKFMPFHTEFEYHMKRFRYIGLSPLFDEIEEGVEVPEYEIVITTDVSKKGKDRYSYAVRKV